MSGHRMDWIYHRGPRNPCTVATSSARPGQRHGAYNKGQKSRLPDWLTLSQRRSLAVFSQIDGFLSFLVPLFQPAFDPKTVQNCRNISRIAGQFELVNKESAPLKAPFF